VQIIKPENKNHLMENDYIQRNWQIKKLAFWMAMILMSWRRTCHMVTWQLQALVENVFVCSVPVQLLH